MIYQSTFRRRGPLASAAAPNPWNLRCPLMPREQRVPPADRPALSYRSQISRDGDDSDGDRNELHRALVAVAP